MNGITDGEVYGLAKGDLSITFSEGSATLNGINFISGSVINHAGSYTLILADANGNKREIKFSVIDSSYPVVTGVGNNELYNSISGEILICFDKGNATLNGKPFLSGQSVGATGNYELIVTAGSTTKVRFTYVHFGDVTGDGNVDVADLAAIKKHLLKIEMLNAPYSLSGDIYQKGNISISDLIAVKKHILRMSFIS